MLLSRGVVKGSRGVARGHIVLLGDTWWHQGQFIFTVLLDLQSKVTITVFCVGCIMELCTAIIQHFFWVFLWGSRGVARGHVVLLGGHVVLLRYPICVQHYCSAEERRGHLNFVSHLLRNGSQCGT